MHLGRQPGPTRRHPWKKDFSQGKRSHKPPPTDGASPLPAPTAMWSTRTADGLVVWAPAKVNLFLEVLGKRPDGYHDLATLMMAVSLYDTLEFKEDRSKAFGFDLVPQSEVAPREDRPSLSTGPENLICRAAELLRLRTGHEGGARVRLHKRIPLAAGLAGGSSDAAATLFGLN